MRVLFFVSYHDQPLRPTKQNKKDKTHTHKTQRHTDMQHVQNTKRGTPSNEHTQTQRRDKQLGQDNTNLRL